jgi:hypothetical protein
MDVMFSPLSSEQRSLKILKNRRQYMSDTADVAFSEAPVFQNRRGLSKGLAAPPPLEFGFEYFELFPLQN